MIVGISDPVVVLVALVLDHVIREPPNRFHPVAWIGSAIGWARGHAPPQGWLGPLCYGAGLMVMGLLMTAGIGFAVQHGLHLLPTPLRWLMEALVINMLFSLRGLARAAGDVRQALEAGNLEGARHDLSWHLVSRDTSQLESSQIAAATVESVAENASDSVVAPLLFYAIGGLPGILMYRFINTADAMFGYRDAQFLWLGKIPARTDDVVNLIPARLTAVAFILASLVGLGHPRSAWKIWWRDARVTDSPNAGHPMSSMAGALEIELVKVDHYQIGSGFASPTTGDIARAVQLLYGATIVAGLGCALLARGLA